MRSVSCSSSVEKLQSHLLTSVPGGTLTPGFDGAINIKDQQAGRWTDEVLVSFITHETVDLFHIETRAIERCTTYYFERSDSTTQKENMVHVPLLKPVPQRPASSVVSAEKRKAWGVPVGLVGVCTQLYLD